MQKNQSVPSDTQRLLDLIGYGHRAVIVYDLTCNHVSIVNNQALESVVELGIVLYESAWVKH